MIYNILTYFIPILFSRPLIDHFEHCSYGSALANGVIDDRAKNNTKASAALDRRRGRRIAAIASGGSCTRGLMISATAV